MQGEPGFPFRKPSLRATSGWREEQPIRPGRPGPTRCAWVLFIPWWCRQAWTTEEREGAERRRGGRHGGAACHGALPVRARRLGAMSIPAQGETLTYGRTFTIADVRAFADVSNDRGVHHVQLDGEGRLLVHGLLTATIPTKLGGDLDYLAQEMAIRFHRPVLTGDNVGCACRETVVEDSGDRTDLEFEI